MNKQILSNNWFIVRYSFRAAPLYTLMTCLLMAAHAAVQFFEFVYMPKFMIDAIQYNKPFSVVLWYTLFVFSVASLWLLVNTIHYNVIMPRGKVAVNKRLQKEIYDIASRMDLACYDNPAFYNDFVWAISESDKRTAAALDTIRVLLGTVTQVILSGAFLIALNWEGIFFVMLSLAGSMFFNLRRNKKTFELDLAMKPLQRKRDYVSRVFYLADYAKELRLNPIAGRLHRLYGETNVQINREIDSRTKPMVAQEFAADFLFSTFVVNGLYILYIMRKIMVEAVLSYGSAVSLVNATRRVSGGLLTLSRTIPQLQQNSLYIEKIRSFLAYQSELAAQSAPASEQQPLPSYIAPLEFKNVSFTYPGTGEPLLKNISFTLEPNKSVAIVGYNGAGKTTLTKLLMRLYDVNQGEILYNGVNIKQYDLMAYRDLFGATFQDYELFATSLADNVSMGMPTPQREEIIRALENSGFGEKLASMARGIDTTITKEFDDQGTLLSGGEAQKVAIARVLYKNCPIIVLDEPSSALDPISEYNMNEAILKEASNKTVVFISHRLSTTRMADMIYMIEEGRIIEQGSHKELMDLNGKYAYMFNLQAERYRIHETAQTGT
ncbi:ATP-binding cassette subfamily B protein [Paenibacillus cellulosilyticus]|uniref:ATP-binding cassette subfamily B protein n=1 Tax=Paenibacillus cellulosilyticus TaxID=375489 RepID=A0A2V2YVV9_9BACL|nr:ABC transporter ATP-binding protein [Paenibacillus cellulosilyticus]PWW02756.1 ATP-binding cassette subfamily B protein [Paenibacillus cellulosilyticus]QKS45679.1 ABC transporter ATP-binding protein [Paenibacillus cellulosilyticus]